MKNRPKINNNQLALFLGASIFVTPEFIKEVIEDFGYLPAYDTNTEFKLMGVSQNSFTISAQGGALMKVFQVEEYGDKALLELTPYYSFDLAAFTRALDRNLREYESAFAADTINLLSDSLNVVTAASMAIDVFQWIPAGLARSKNEKPLPNELFKQQIEQALEKNEEF